MEMTKYSRLDDEFKEKFNELDALAKELYPNAPAKNHTALKKFKDTLPNSEKKVLTNLIDARHILTHSEWKLIHIDSEALAFMSGIIDGLRRKMNSNQKNHEIYAKLENMRSKNLNEMSKKLEDLNQQLYSMDSAQKNKYKSRLRNFIEKERKARDYNEIRKIYFDFMDLYHKIMSNEKNYRKKFTLEKRKESAISSITNLYNSIVGNMSFLKISTKKSAKRILEDGVRSLKNAQSFDVLDERLESIEDALESLDE